MDKLAADLRRMKTTATAILVVAAAIFVSARIAEGRGVGWAGPIRAMAEAAMVGGLADWFAVTALFRRPLGLPIPHTAIVPRRKDEIGRGLGEFVQSNFLTPDLLVGRLRDIEPARRIGEFLVRKEVAAAVADQVAKGLRGALDTVEADAGLGEVLARAVTERLSDVPAGPTIARALEVASADGRHRELVPVLARQLQVVMTQSKATLRASFLREAPWWVGEGVFNRLFERVQATLVDVAAHPEHALRAAIDDQLKDWIERLRQDLVLIAKAETWKHEILVHPVTAAWVGGLWAEARELLLRNVASDTSELRVRMVAIVGSIGERILNDESLRARIDEVTERVVASVVRDHGHEIANLITVTVERWDAEDTSRRIENQIGRDLQFVRINGTVVGGLVGLVLYIVSRWL